ncbi:MAG: rhodanese-like domain-containing protein [Azospirillaceae bacterium]|nr:rhodanese-like domain-containing protein [Azospirillaceae bacterium]
MKEPFEVDPTIVAARRDAGETLVILDVREPWEREICRIDGSLDIPLQSLPGRVAEVPTDRSVIVICHHGGRSAQATMWLRQQGISRAVNLAGGIDAWARQVDPALKVY